MGSRSKSQRGYVTRATGVWNAKSNIVQEIDFVDVSALPSLYASFRDLRTKYVRIARIVPEYLESLRKFCRSEAPEQAELGAALAAERLTVALLDAYTADLQTAIERVEGIVRTLVAAKSAKTPAVEF